MAQKEKVKNQPYADLKWFHLGFHVGLHAQDLILTNSGVATNGETWYAEIPNYSPGFSVGVIGDMYLNPYFNLRFTPTIHFGDKKIVFRRPEMEGVEGTDENPVVLAKGVDENGKEFEQRIYINDVNPSNATVVEMRALEAHYKVEKQGGFTSLPLEAGNMGLNDRRDFISMFKKSIEDLNKLGRFDLSLLWTKSMDTYLNLPNANSKYK